MSATPIPRTLEMAITGIREMSTIATPPEERHPVLTFAGPYDEAQVTAAIRRELLREGQVFYVHNRVQSIDKVARRIAELVPEARVVTAHGQMSEQRLEQVMVDFWERRADVLVCTTIVEAGLDISTANTLLIERADLLGLSQLHQLRGRVGRSRERGYAYFLYPPDKPLTETAHDRLATIAAHTDLGRRHGGGDEGPGDPRRRQHARRRAVRPHRRRRLRPLHPAGRRGGGGVPRPGHRAGARDADRAAGRRPPARPTTSSPSGCGWRCTSGWPRCAAEADVEPRSRPSCDDRYGPPPAAGAATCWRWPGSGCWPGTAGLTEIVTQGNFIRFGPAEPARVAGACG